MPDSRRFWVVFLVDSLLGTDRRFCFFVRVPGILSVMVAPGPTSLAASRALTFVPVSQVDLSEISF